VLNAEQGDEGYFRTSAMGYPLRLNKLHAQWLLELEDSTRSQLCWGTTWQDNANIHIGPAIGLPDLPVANFDDVAYHEHRNFAKWKSDGVIKLANGLPFAWFDDEPSIGWHLSTYHSDLKFCFIEVDPMLGLQKKHIDSAYEWLTSL
jgi:hypothetical protein